MDPIPEMMPINPSACYRRFKLLFVPLLIFSLCSQLAVVLTQLDLIKKGYFDFVLYYSAAQIIGDGNGARLYDLELQSAYQQTVRGHRDRDLPFNHLPYELVPIVALAKLSFPAAHLIWTGINVLVLALIVARLSRFLSARTRGLAILAILAFFPTLTALKMGQDSVITTYLLVETFVSLKLKRHLAAGAMLALGLYKPQFVLPMAGIFLWQRRWRTLAGFLGMSLVLAAVSFAMVGRTGMAGLISLWLPMIDRGHVVWPELMTNLRGLVHVLLGLAGASHLANGMTLVISVAVYGLTLLLWRREIDEGSDLFTVCFALAIVTTALVSFHLYSYDGMLLLIPLTLMLDRALQPTSSYSNGQRLLFGVLIAWFIPLLPNLLLSSANLAWWALPLPVLFCLLVTEVRLSCRSRPCDG